MIYPRYGRFLAVMLAGGFAVTAWSSTFTVTNTANSGPGTFFQAITNANSNPGPDTIVFQISGTPPFTISPTVALPSITDPVVIDATTQPGFAGKPVIELSGAATSGSTIGLRFVIGSSFSTLRGMAINRFPSHAINLTSASNSIQGNFIGTDLTGTLARGGGVNSDGILVGSAGNLIGGTNSGDGNVISGGNNIGIYFQNANGNIVQGNFVGLNAAGSGSLSNLNNGIVINASAGNLIGGAFPAAGNIVSGNGASGIYLTGAAATGNVIQGNRIGTDSSGSNAVSNVAGDGITVAGAPGNLISGNLISGNGFTGVSIGGAGAINNRLLGNFIGTDASGATNLGNHYAGVTVYGTGGNQVGGTNAGDGNVISGNILDGIALTTSTSNNLILGNLIGLSAAGTNALHNGQNGVSISGGSSNVIGGTGAGARNVISGNSVNGIGILLLTDKGNSVLGNYIGTDVTGTKAIGNTLAGVRIQSSSNAVGGVAAGAGNVISGNGQQGVLLTGTNGNAAGNLIQGNLIGLDVSGANNVGNGDAGVTISGAANNLVGGTAAGARNVISANAYAGIYLYNAGATNNILQGNYIGTDVTGTAGHGNSFTGIVVQNTTATQIGGTANGAGNLISGNNNRGIYLYGGASLNVILGNFIGTMANGVTALGNVYHGIDIDSGCMSNTVGGAAAGAGNRIAFAQSVYCGVRVRTGAGNNLISGNAIFSNGALGIDLSPTDGSANAGVNPIVDCESGIAANAANAGQNFPTLAEVNTGASTRIRGTLDGKTGKTYALQFFASPAGDSSGYGEGQVFLGQTNLTLGAACSANFTAYLPAPVSPGWVVTATATDATNNTSEFSAAIAALPVPPVQAAKSGPGQLAISWTNNGGSYALQQTYSFTPPIVWSTVSGSPALLNNFMVATVATTNSSVFYRLAAP